MEGFFVSDLSIVNIDGGSVRNFFSISGESTVNITGGSHADELEVSGQSTVNIYGTDFNVPYGSIPDEMGRLGGILGDGTPIDFEFLRAAGATINLLPIPEPSRLPISLARNAVPGSLPRQGVAVGIDLRHFRITTLTRGTENRVVQFSLIHRFTRSHLTTASGQRSKLRRRESPTRRAKSRRSKRPPWT